jgi:hypothetical protein
MVRSEQQISCYLGDLAYALCKMYIAPVVSPFTIQNRDVVLNLVTEIAPHSQFDGSHESYPRIGGSQRSFRWVYRFGLLFLSLQAILISIQKIESLSDSI